MAVEQAVLPDLASLAPGPELAAELERLTLSDIPDGQVVEVLRAAGRQLAHLQALSWSAMVEIGRRRPVEVSATGAERTWAVLDSWHWASSQIGAALSFSGRRADIEYAMACQLLQELPLVWEALWAGRIDGSKAKVFAGYLVNLTAAQTEVICRRLLPGAPRWTCGQLAHRLLREVLAIDPAFTRRRYERGARERGVWGYLAEDGTAVLSGRGLSPVEAAAAAERLAELAAAVRAAGHPGTVSQLRADLFVRLLDGRYAGYSSAEIITAMLSDSTEHDRAAADRPAADRPDGDRAAGEPAAGEPAAGDRAAGEPAAGEPAADPRPTADSDPIGGAAPVPLDPVDSGSAHDVAAVNGVKPTGLADPATVAEPAAVDPVCADPVCADPVCADPVCADPGGSGSVGGGSVGVEPATPAESVTDAEPVTDAAADGAGSAACGAGHGGAAATAGAGTAGGAGPRTEGARTGIEVRVGLGTLLGLDDHPAEVPGWGPIDAVNARLVVGQQRAARWRFAVLDDEGYLLLGGVIRRRPTAPDPAPGPGPGPGREPERAARCRGGVVELHVRARLLAELAAPPDPGTAQPAAQPAAQAGAQAGVWAGAGLWAGVVADIARQYADRDRRLAGLDTEPAARFPSAGLRRHVQLRDRTCVAPGCRRPARHADLDHTCPHARGGSTVRANLGPLCERHHTMKHREGWTLTQPAPGRFCWRAPLGQLYWTRGEPIAADLPDPLPGPEGHHEPDEPVAAGIQWEVGPIFHPSEWDKLRAPDPPAPPVPDDEPPPF